MRHRFALALVCIFCLADHTFSQPNGKPPDKKAPLDQIDGYKRHTVEGFTLLVSKETLDADASKFKRPPLEVLELELKTIVRIMPAKSVDALRNMLVWVEWDEQTPLKNGRGGSALAVYSGGHQEQLYREGKHPLKAKAVTILRMKSLTAEHQPEKDSGRCVLLHEFSHAVHDLLLGRDSPAVKATYRQAMDRKLYDRDQYLSTNEAEFFAELSCAYYDQLHHYPHNRDELKQHDPVAFKLMESTWGKDAKRVELAKPKSLAEANGADEFDLTVTPAALTVGKTLVGPETTATTRTDKVLVIGYFGGSDKAVLSRYAAIHAELAMYGVQVIAGPAFVTLPENVKRDAEAREVPFTVVDRLLLRIVQEKVSRSQPPAHTLVFDATGKCVFRGSGYQAAPHVRAVVWNSLLEKSGVPVDAKTLNSAAKMGVPFSELLAKSVTSMESNDAKLSAAAKTLVGELTAPGKALLEEAAGKAKNDPVSAFLLLEPLPLQYKGTKVASQAETQLRQLKANALVAAELRARALFDQLKKLDLSVMASPGSFDVTSPSFQRDNAASIAQMRGLLDQLKRKHPAAKATSDAERVMKKYGV